MRVPSAGAVCFISSSPTSTCWNNFTCSTASGLSSTPTKSVRSAYPDAPAGSLAGQVISERERRQDPGSFDAAEVRERGDEWKDPRVILILLPVHPEDTFSGHSTRMWLCSCLKTEWNQHLLVILTISLWQKCVWLHVLWSGLYFYTFAAQYGGIFKNVINISHLRRMGFRCREVPGFFVFL